MSTQKRMHWRWNWDDKEQDRLNEIRFIRYLRWWVRLVTVFLVVSTTAILLLALTGCTDDRDTVNARVDNVFKVSDVVYQDDDDCLDGCPRVLIKVTDLDEGGDFVWDGRINEGIHKLEIINVGECYRRPLQDSAEKVSCSEHE